MSDDDGKLRRQHYADRPDSLAVLRPMADGAQDIFLSIGTDGVITTFSGHVDLGTGIRTSLAQIVAEELDVPLDHVAMVLGHTDPTPNQGATIASETIQMTAIPLRQAAAQARHHLIALAAQQFDMAPDAFEVVDGVIRARDGGNPFVAYGDLLKGRTIRLELAADVAVKPVADYRLVGRPVDRVDIPAKATGTWTYVHDVRVDGMLHGRVVRPPYAGIDVGAHVGTSLIAVDEASVADIPGLVAVVAIGDFVGVVAEREENAIRAAQQLKVQWKPPPILPDLNAPADAIRANPGTARTLLDRGNVDAALASAEQSFENSYVWPYQMHASIGPSCSVADYDAEAGHLTLWSGTQNPHNLRNDIALLMGLLPEHVEIIRYEAAGCYGRNCADDVGADAALLARAVGRPVRVQLTREQEHAWEPKGAAQVMDIRGGIDAQGEAVAYDFATRYPSNMAPTLALLLTGTIPAVPQVIEMGDRTSVPPYAYPNARVTVHDMPPIARAAWFRGVSALPNSFAHESFIDELATAAGVDPIDYRLRYLDDARAVDLIKAVAERAKWQHHTRPQTLGGEGDLLYGRGFAYAVYVHGKFPGTAAAWSAWIADVAVNKKTGEIAVTRIVVGQDTGLMINPAGVQHQIHGNVIQSTSRVLKEQVGFDQVSVTSKEWGAYPILAFPEVPEIDVLMIPRPNDPPLGAGESAAVPSAAAIANAIFDATGVRFRELPLTPERVLAALDPTALNSKDPPSAPARKKRWWQIFGGASAAAAAAMGLFSVTASPWRPSYTPIERPDPAVFSSATIKRGEQVAAIGACNVCHIGADGTAFAGGRALETPFGIVYAPNITPDPATGIGAWSYPAFERAMREGIHRDGHHLYPAHPYTGFTKATDADLQALYAYLMAGQAVAAKAPETKLAFPFNIRPLMAAWNALFLRPGPLPADPARSPQWNRGAYLVEGLGHCGACHTDRNALGAERTGAAHLSGGFADGWEAPALNALSAAPIPWTEDALYAYLRTGHAKEHGGAAGPMADVVSSLKPLPDADVRAMAVYLASLNPAASSAPVAAPPEPAAKLPASAGPSARRGEWLFAGACASCHESDGTLAQSSSSLALTSLALNSNLHSAHADNVLQSILNGVAAPTLRADAAQTEATAMPGFRNSFNDAQVADLVAYLRSRFAPAKPAWDGVAATASRIRAGR